MRNSARLLAALVVLAANLSSVPSSFLLRESNVAPPEPPREFRGAWVATVANIDWPSRPGLTTDQQQAEMIAILDTAQQLNMNAIVLQVRPACDALYESRLEPWSEYLTGNMGEPPSPYYDPLKFAVDEAHKRGIELHAWFNPYRARHAESRVPVAPNHISVTHPELVRTYGTSLWLDPSEKGVQDHSIDVILDVVKRYDIDGVHLDDYFYPYKEKGPDGRILDFPDEANWERYLQSNGRLSRDDWRREQVNRFIERLYREIKRKKSWVKFGISPFGIWRPGTPPSIRGFDAYQEIYADSRLWLNQGWMDYWSPQLYWKHDQVGQSYSELLRWWVGENSKGRHIWPGNYTSRVSDGSRTSWTADEIVRQINITRRQEGAGGNLHFSMKSLMQSRTGVAEALAKSSYVEPALIPASPWLKHERLGKPKISLDRTTGRGNTNLEWRPTGHGKTWLWLVQVQRRTNWRTMILPAAQTSQNLADWLGGSRAAVVALTPVDRCGNLGPHTVIEVGDETVTSGPNDRGGKLFSKK
jgi:uncharacterized lipoprotein YddW (UPF0748 family)